AADAAADRRRARQGGARRLPRRRARPRPARAASRPVVRAWRRASPALGHGAPLFLSPEPAEHVHGQAHAADARSRVLARPRAARRLGARPKTSWVAKRTRACGVGITRRRRAAAGEASAANWHALPPSWPAGFGPLTCPAPFAAPASPAAA